MSISYIYLQRSGIHVKKEAGRWRQIFLLIYSPLLQYPFSSPFPLTQINCSCFFSEKKAVSAMISTELGITRWNKTDNKPLYQGWMSQPSRRKNVLWSSKRVRDTLASVIKSPTKIQAKEVQHVHREPWANLCWLIGGHSGSVTPYEHCLVDSVGHFLVVFWDFWLLQSFPTSSVGSLNST